MSDPFCLSDETHTYVAVPGADGVTFNYTRKPYTPTGRQRITNGSFVLPWDEAAAFCAARGVTLPPRKLRVGEVEIEILSAGDAGAGLDRRRFRLTSPRSALAPDWRDWARVERPWCEVIAYRGDGRSAAWVGCYGGEVGPMAWPALFAREPGPSTTWLRRELEEVVFGK